MNSETENEQFQSSLDKLYYIDNIILKYKTLKRSANPNFILDNSTDDNMTTLHKTLNDVIKPDILRILQELQSTFTVNN
mgnify:CR=1 FL=1